MSDSSQEQPKVIKIVYTEPEKKDVDPVHHVVNTGQPSAAAGLVDSRSSRSMPLENFGPTSAELRREAADLIVRAGQAARFSPEQAEEYRQEATRLQQEAARIDQGNASDKQRRVFFGSLRDVIAALSARLDDIDSDRFMPADAQRKDEVYELIMAAKKQLHEAYRLSADPEEQK